MEWVKAVAMLIGRILLILIFIKSGLGKIENFAGTAQYMAKAGMPYTNFFLLGAIFFELAGSVDYRPGVFDSGGRPDASCFFSSDYAYFPWQFIRSWADDSFHEKRQYVWRVPIPSRNRAWTIQHRLPFRGRKGNR